MGRGFLKIPRPILLIRITSRNLHLTPKITDLFLRLLIILKDFIILIICSWYICIDSRQAIEALMRKRSYNPETADAKEKQKMMGYLMRKGFSYQDVRNVLQVCE